MIYDIAGLRVLIKNRCHFTTEFCKAYLSSDQESPFDIETVVTNEEFYKEKELSVGFSDGYIENICLYRKLCVQLPTRNRMLLHCAVLDYEGGAYAFLGRSGTGKSTHTGLWLQYVQGTDIVNGDKPILSFTDDAVLAHGTPWMGKEGLGRKVNAPLKALVFLEQAKENVIRKLSPSETSMKLFSQMLFPTDEENAAKTLELADEMINRVPAYLLKCDISEEAVRVCYEAVTGKPYLKKNKE